MTFSSRSRVIRVGATLGLLLTVVSGAEGRPTPVSPPAQGTLLDVPFLSQTEQLCGGAALAMVLRYWGATATLPQDFESLVDRTAGGIATSRLTRAASDRGWPAVASGAPADAPLDALAAHVAQGRPVIVLVEDRPGVHHYVVVVGVTPAAVVLHDPARAPFVVMTRDDFVRRWNVTSRWMLLVLPGNGDDTRVVAAAAASPPSATTMDGAPGATPCDALVAQGVAAGRAREDVEAERILRSASTLCPASAAAQRELAGLRLVQQRWGDSVTFAEEAVRRDAADVHAWELLATSRYVLGDQLGALAAWNHVNQPTTDVITVEGLRRTAQPVVTGLLGLRPAHLLGAGAFLRASRRLEELPSSTRAVLRYTPIDDGKATVEAYVGEGTRLPHGWIGWATVGARALIAQDIRVDMAALASQGDLWSASYRWPPTRPRVGLQLALPTPGQRPGTIRVETFWERQTYARPLLENDRSREERRRVSVDYSDWVTGILRLQGGAASDRLAGQRFLAVDAGAMTRLFDDHIALTVRAERWMAAGVPGFSSIDVTGDWRSTRSPDVAVWSARAGISDVGDAAPLALWPGAGSSADRGVVLRARPLVRRQILSGEVFGRRLAFATVERQRPIYQSPYGRLSLATFVDAGKAWKRLDTTTASRLHIDVGVGVRIDRSGDANQVRVDLGVGLRDGGVRASAGYVAGWGRR